MKASEIRKMTPEQLNEKLAGLKKDLFYLRMQHATNQLDNPVSRPCWRSSPPLTRSSEKEVR